MIMPNHRGCGMVSVFRTVSGSRPFKIRNMPIPVIALRLLFSALTLFAIATQFSIHIALGFSAINFFSYFTNLSNLFAAVVFGATALLWVKVQKTSHAADLVRGISVVNMVVVGIVFALLLRNVDLGSLLPWVNFLLHYVMPIVVLLDWLLAPPQIRFTFRQVLLCQVVPLVYLAYILVRGAAVNWYPYPFLNPAKVGGYGGVALYALGISIVFFFSAWILLTLGNRMGVREKFERT